MPNLGRPRRINVFENLYTNEYVRLSTLDLIADEIARKQVVGAVAELGVYKGYFARRINEAFPGRTLYLFDTFAGFDAAEEQADRNRGLVHKRDFSDTNERDVLRRMPSPSHCVVRKGLFPSTAVGLESELFCFVSIDTDLHDPILAGLNFFYDRLSPGGYIFVHDYNNSQFPGAKAAVQTFAEARKISLVPLPDVYGTAILTR
ncbi:TylF/MycF/NovP-related O-methyltransferase [Bradyrhizobium sp. TM102]|uniref:TylF/MycF/NovP-related O-methyltransferase n=1 Tax=Bradyrhizobium sp. TM102 TaxID=2599819 RepID=UPI001260C77E|nr:TylF/MycF/NovP-related O-methyltransferase [Bradyrhizobium sp. TM102]BBO14649.1 macrocin O-methyltransferase [Bradyrhizobium sp. TM102]